MKDFQALRLQRGLLRLALKLISHTGSRHLPICTCPEFHGAIEDDGRRARRVPTGKIRPWLDGLGGSKRGNVITNSAATGMPASSYCPGAQRHAWPTADWDSCKGDSGISGTSMRRGRRAAFSGGPHGVNRLHGFAGAWLPPAF